MPLSLSLAPNDRTLKPPILFAGAYILACAVFLPRVSPAHFQPALALALFFPNIPILATFLFRAWSAPAERRGWLILAASIPFVLLSLALLAAAGPLQSRPRPIDWAFLSISLLIGCIQAWGLLAWPWRNQGRESKQLDLLGSLLFGSSVFLLLWVVGIWQAAFQGQAVVHARILAYAGRLSITSGVAVYLFCQDPRRIRGPLGWVLAAMLVFCLAIGLFQPIALSAGLMGRVNPWFGVAPLAPLFLVFAAWSPHPVEVPEEHPPLRIPLGEIVPYIPFLIAGGVLGLALLKNRGPLVWPLLTFLGITGLLVLRQFLLLREIKTVNAHLEDRVTQRTQALEKMQSVLIKTERMNTLATLGAGLAHDLNNLLSVVRNSAELMEMELEEGQPPRSQDLARIMEASSKAGNLTHRLMAFVRQEPGLQSSVRLNLSDALVAMQDFLRMLLPRNIRMDLEIEDSTPAAQVDPSLLEQVLVNLISNARDAMPEGGQVRIRLRPGATPGGDPAAILEVSDTGPGIPPEIQEAIFDAFFTTKPEGKGTGLGLASVRTLMGAQGGSVEVRSLPAQGTTFRLTFPVEA